jgi:uncharacterized FAD-dependent dehydrogenase
MKPRLQELTIFIALDEPDDEGALRTHAAEKLGLQTEDIFAAVVKRRSLDARRGRRMGHHFQLSVHIGGACHEPVVTRSRFRLEKPLSVVIAGSGPAGTFAALRLAEAGANVVISELGKPVQPRRRDIAQLVRHGLVNPSSNYCFGEGGAGTFSDGKLYTRIKNRRAVAEVLATLVEFGAPAAIAVESRPHVGSDRLPKVLLAVRDHLEKLGVEYRFEDPLVDFTSDSQARINAARLQSDTTIDCQALIVSVGHSARSLFEALVARGVAHEPKPFAVGVRVEHPQPLINRIQYGKHASSRRLSAAFYELTAQVAGRERGVYSFCMCPGGWIVDSSTEPGRLCTNGMSLKRRDSPHANAALAVTVRPKDLEGYGTGPDDPLAGIAFQRALEERAHKAGGGASVAPAQRLDDFLKQRLSQTVAATSYRRGIVPYDVAALFPHDITNALREALPIFERTMPGFVTKEAQLIGVETRTSCPLRFLRDPKTLESQSHPGLYPGGEGAGHAGGIVSAAVDGLRIADAILARHGATEESS